MRARSLLAVTLTVAASLAVAAPAAAAPGHGWDVRCGQSPDPGFGWFDSKGYNVSCRAVRKAANRYVFGGDPSPKGWGRCDEDQIGDEVWRVDCKRRRSGEHQHVRFKFGA